MNVHVKDTDLETELKVIGTRPIRPDGADKVTGRANYGADFRLPGMLHGAVLRSPHPHARILSIDTRRAAALPGVRAVVTAKDFAEVAHEDFAGPGEGVGSMQNVSANIMAQDKVLYEGHAVAAVAATSLAVAEEAVRLIEVAYEILPHVIDVADAIAPDAPLLHENLITTGAEPPPEQPSNTSMIFNLKRGDIAAAFETADIVIERRFTTQPVHQGYIEPHACVAAFGGDGQATIWCCTQSHFDVRAICAGLNGMKLADLRVTASEIGGGFGGKTTVYLEPVALMLARKSGRPVKMVMRRDDIFRGSGPAPGSMSTVKLGAKRDGSLVAAHGKFHYQSGAYPDRYAALLAPLTSTASYRMPNFDLTGHDVVSNMPDTHAYRAPAAPQAQFPVECLIDEIAEQLGLDPVDMRMKNVARSGDPNAFGAPTYNLAIVETLEAVKAHPHYSAPLEPGHGRGFALGIWGNGGGESSAQISLAGDGTIIVATGSPDIGGSRASMAMMAAETLGVPYDAVRAVVLDTGAIGYTQGTGGSRVTFATGMAVTEAAQQLIEQMRQRVAQIWDIAVDNVVWRDGQAHCLDTAQNHEPLSLAEIAEKARITGGPLTVAVGINAMSPAPSVGAHLCDVAVDRETGHVTVVRYTAFQDVGRAIHPSYVEGQLQGGAVQGIGWALNEAYFYDSAGRLGNAGFLDYRIPVASDLPMIDAVLIEVPNSTHPYGVKGVGETPIVPPLAAVANAVSRAIGVRLCDLPLTPERVFDAINARG